MLFGEMVEWSITAVLKTAVPRGTGGSNPSLSAKKRFTNFCKPFFVVQQIDGFSPVLLKTSTVEMFIYKVFCLFDIDGVRLQIRWLKKFLLTKVPFLGK